MNYRQIIARLQRHQEYVHKQLFLDRDKNEIGWTVLCTCLRGSQNYGLDHKDSDVDSVTIIVPTICALAFSKTYSKEYTLDEEKLTVVDIRTYIEQLKKGNPALLETTYTDYFVVPDQSYSSYKEELREIGKKLLYCQPKTTAFSVIGNIFSCLKKCNTENNYDSKFLCNAYRLYEWLRAYLKDELDYNSPFEMKNISFLQKYWSIRNDNDLRNFDSAKNLKMIHTHTTTMKELLATNNLCELEKELGGTVCSLDTTTDITFEKLLLWYLKVFREINKI